MDDASLPIPPAAEVPVQDERLLAAAARVLQDAGWQGLTIEAVAEAAGLSRVTAWRLGASRETLIASLLSQLGQDYRQAMWPAIVGTGIYTLTGISAGLVFGIADALTRRTVQLLDTGHLSVVLTSWPGYSLIAVSLVGIWLMESAFNAAPLHISLPGITAAEPVSGIVLGIVVFRDSVHVSPGTLALQAAGLVALLIGVIMVARSPALARLRALRPTSPGPAEDTGPPDAPPPAEGAWPEPGQRHPHDGFPQPLP